MKSTTSIALTTVAALTLPVLALAAPADIPNTFADGGVISAEAFNENFEALADAIDDNDARIAALEAGSAVPAGTIAFFALDACPDGWEEATELQGRVPVGLSPGGTVGTAVGTALPDEGMRTISEVPAHGHTAGTLSGTASSSGSDHSHTIGGGGHDHPLQLEAGSPYGTYGVAGVNDGAGGGSSSAPVLNNTGTHSHTVSGGSHTHPVSVSGSTAVEGELSVDVTMPYVQLRACERS